MSMVWNRRAVIHAGLGTAAVIGALPYSGSGVAAAAARGYIKSPYYKSIGFLNRLPNLTQDQFVDHWVSVHAPLFEAMPGLVKYRLNIIDPLLSKNAPYDGAAEVWFESEQALLASRDSEIAKKSAADGKLFLQPGGLVLATTEYVIIEPPVGVQRPKAKRLGVVQRNMDIPHAEFVHQWVDVHAPDYLKTTPGIRGYTINVVHESEKTAWGGYASLWWDDQKSYDEAASVNAADMANQRQQPPHERSFFGNGFMSAIVHERVVR
jgi:uncharacterized protein (TIGR02118 family)